LEPPINAENVDKTLKSYGAPNNISYINSQHKERKIFDLAFIGVYRRFQKNHPATKQLGL